MLESEVRGLHVATEGDLRDLREPTSFHEQRTAQAGVEVGKGTLRQ